MLGFHQVSCFLPARAERISELNRCFGLLQLSLRRSFAAFWPNGAFWLFISLLIDNFTLYGQAASCIGQLLCPH